ncbi:hypothetical protein F5Y17DRAFT_470031 [Xylariaceae sp. FL0594]|nr:hypothetical protein F5Y17DRAFT_470031 [Xylariaceae sp. FL0594]
MAHLAEDVTSTFGASTTILTPSVSSNTETVRESQSSEDHVTDVRTRPTGPLPITLQDVYAWREQYPPIGQFAVTESREFVAAGPDGLFSFQQVTDHASMPWSEARPLPLIGALNNISVTGIAIGSERDGNGLVAVYCVAGGALYGFWKDLMPDSRYAVYSNPPLAGYRVSGTPALAVDSFRHHTSKWYLVVPCQTGGLLVSTVRSLETIILGATNWARVDHVATNLGLISSVSAVVAPTTTNPYPRDLAMLRGDPPSYEETSTRIQHPGEVTGNLGLAYSDSKRHMDLLVPSAEGGILHFVRTSSMPDEWHMIARIMFPPTVPAASCISLVVNSGSNPRTIRVYAQCGGVLYQISTSEGAKPWVGSHLRAISGPGPSF